MIKVHRLSFSFILILCILSSYGCNKIEKGKMSSQIHINQLGYKVKDKKEVIFNNNPDSFKVINSSSGKVVLEKSISKGKKDISSGDVVYSGDFTEVNTPGEYYIQTSDGKCSYEFAIGDKVYDSINNALIKGLYLQRCGMALDSKYAGIWAHDACHTAKAVLYTDESVELDVSGGWHDAGDYGLYTVTAGKTLADMLLAYDFFPNSYKSKINIPGSSSIPDILTEAEYELTWLFKMQSPSGGVYHKVTTASFPDFVMPNVDLGTRYVLPVSSTATGDFAAVMALASRIYAPFDKGFSDNCLTAAKKAWDFLKSNPSPILFKNPERISTGEYGDDSDIDERFWAACELFRTTGDSEYNYEAKELGNKLSDFTSFGWQNMSGYGATAYMFAESTLRNPDLYAKIKINFAIIADKLVETSSQDGYNVTLASNEYVWGSNMNVLNNAMLLIIADKLKATTSYKVVATNQWNYIFGLNSLNKSFVTGFGDNSVKHPHHRPSESGEVNKPVPGLIAGGPNSGLQDDIAKSQLGGEPAAKCYLDDSSAYSLNEICICWNSPGIFVSGFVNSN
ncbi:MAG TPA: glycoside hydrolase family 9 protein [Clostridiaceae bacterium]